MVKIESEIIIPQMNNSNLDVVSESNLEVGKLNLQVQSSSSDKTIQMLLNENKTEVKNKPIDKEEQKREAEKGLETIRIFNQLNEEIRKSYDEQEAKNNIGKIICVIHC